MAAAADNVKIQPVSASSTTYDLDDMGASTKPLRPNSRQSSSSQRPVPSYAYEHFHRGKQLRHMGLTSLCRWILTVALAMSIYGVIWSYSGREAMPASKRKEFNALIIGLSIGLGLNLASSLKGDVGELRWWLLSLHDHTPLEADLILQSEHLSRLVMLGWMSRRPVVQVFVFVFMALNLASQLALALLGITYNINPADKFTVTMPGTVAIPDMSDIQTKPALAKNTSRDLDESQAVNARRYTANTFGIVSIAFSDDDIDTLPKPGKIFDPDDPLVFWNDEKQTYTYVFYESSPEGAVWRVINGGDGLSANITVQFDDGQKEDWKVPSVNGPDQTMYLNDPALQSGDTWGQVNVFEASTRDPWAYGCNITIDPVVNAVSKEQEVGVNVTRYAAPAIALQGYGASVYGLTNDTKPYQWQSYPAESAFGSPANGSAELIGRTVARFAIGAIAVTAKSNTNIEARGMVPQKGITLEVTNRTYLHLILGLTVGMQLLIAVVSILIANRVQTPADSQQFNTVNPSSIEQESSNLAQAQQRQHQRIIQQQKQVQRQGSQQKSFGKAPQPTGPIVEQKITQLLNSMRAKPSSPHSQIQAVHTKLPRAKKDEEEMEEDERLLASEEGTKLSSKERRQLRARAYRSRRKEYITQLEAEIAKLVNEIGDLRAQNRALADENRRLSDQSPFRQGR
ncbi:transposase-like protein [Purpureocillium lavendulum]|uniref:Transposase-like protein n=1 Tax=Purpureocillium lavendulum TaxID=1247861 RepID=A0AB34FCG1_9HYPO|nr:transposase-like protein [Purpureocillium lavendulum]